MKGWSINLVFIFRCSSSPRNPVFTRRVDSLPLVFSLSSHRHSEIGFYLYFSLHRYIINKINNCHGSPVYVRHVDPSVLTFRLSSNRHSCISLSSSPINPVCVRSVDSSLQYLVSHHTDIHIEVLSVVLTSSIHKHHKTKSFI